VADAITLVRDMLGDLGAGVVGGLGNVSGSSTLSASSQAPTSASTRSPACKRAPSRCRGLPSAPRFSERGRDALAHIGEMDAAGRVERALLVAKENRAADLGGTARMKPYTDGRVRGPHLKM